MFNKAKNLLFLLSFLLFFFLVIQYYFSENNVIFANKSRSLFLSNNIINSNDLPILKNDTKNIIIYKNDLKDFKNNGKARFWEKLFTNTNE
jgi:hypothetical protein|tara:strand:- start:198 stop:470 length:273 start_codon:yes stop_codon:yes gene_type:complete